MVSPLPHWADAWAVVARARTTMGVGGRTTQGRRRNAAPAVGWIDDVLASPRLGADPASRCRDRAWRRGGGGRRDARRREPARLQAGADPARDRAPAADVGPAARAQRLPGRGPRGRHRGDDRLHGAGPARPVLL